MPKEQTIKKSALAPTVLIAGGTGFIGLHLAEALLLKDARVIVVDTITPNKDLYVKPLLQNPKFALFDCDINKQIPPEIQSVDYIVNLA
ncbi:MAG: Nucleoside-diphosphate-sugar epimerase, partial [candidate division WWE3 bacterium GW2011_GWC1_47_10]